MTEARKLSARRVLVAVGNYPPGYGGAGLRVHNTYRRLRQRLPLELQAATVRGRGDMPDCASYEDVAVFQTSANTGLVAQFLALGRLIFTTGPRRYDLVHALGQSGVATAASLWALLLGIPLVRELTVNGPVGRGLDPLSVLQRAGFRRANLVIALNAGLRRRLVEAGVAPGRIWERPNPVDTSVYWRPDTNERAGARRALGLDPTRPTHLLLGRLCARKNQLFALDVLAGLPSDHCLLLLGPVLQGDQPYVEQMRARIATLGLADRVIFRPGYVEHPRQAYHAADCCWIPSTSEGMPNVLLEAQVCGLPVVVNRDLELDEHLSQGINGFACALEAAAFAAAARQSIETLTKEAARQAIAKAGAERYGAERIDTEFARRLAAILKLSPAEAPLAAGCSSSGAS